MKRNTKMPLPKEKSSQPIEVHMHPIDGVFMLLGGFLAFLLVLPLLLFVLIFVLDLLGVTFS